MILDNVRILKSIQSSRVRAGCILSICPCPPLAGKVIAAEILARHSRNCAVTEAISQLQQCARRSKSNTLDDKSRREHARQVLGIRAHEHNEKGARHVQTLGTTIHKHARTQTAPARHDAHEPHIFQHAQPLNRFLIREYVFCSRDRLP